MNCDVCGPERAGGVTMNACNHDDLLLLAAGEADAERTAATERHVRSCRACADELARLQDRVPPFPAAQSRALVEKAFGRPIDAIFASFDAEPVASASIAQVHFAVLKDGREVIVKIRRPGIVETVEADLRLLDRLARVAEDQIPALKPYGPVRLVHELARSLRRELDLAAECRNAERIARMIEQQRDKAVALRRARIGRLIEGSGPHGAAPVLLHVWLTHVFSPACPLSSSHHLPRWTPYPHGAAHRSLASSLARSRNPAAARP